MKRYTFCAMVLIYMLTIAFGAPATTVLVDPATQESPPAGETLTVSVKVEDVTDLYGYQILLIFDNTALKFTGIQEEDFLPEAEIPPGMLDPCPFPFIMLGWEEQEKDGQLIPFQAATSVVEEVNLAGGVLAINGTCGPVSGTNGTGLLFTVTFEVLEAKASVLQLGNANYPVELVDHEAGLIDTDVIDGEITDVQDPLPPVIKEHSPDSRILALEATYDETNVHGYTYIDIWKDSMLIEPGMFLEFQVVMFSVFQGSVDLHTSDGSSLRDSGAVDQNGLNAHPNTDLSGYARNHWYHRTISLDALAGKTLDGVMIATDSEEHDAGMFRLYVDNIQITDGDYILKAIYIDEETIPSTGTDTATETTFAGTGGMSDYSVTIVGATPVTPAGKLISSWGSIKSAL